MIKNFGKNDTLRITDGDIQSTIGNNNDVIINVKDGVYTGAITLGGAASLVGSTSPTGKLITNDKFIYVDTKNYIINRSNNTLIAGSEGDDHIANSGERVTIQSGKGNDTIIGSDEFGEMYLFAATDGNNVITNFGKNDTLQMTSGKSMSYAIKGDDVLVTLKDNNSNTGTVTLKGAAELAFKQSGKVLTIYPFNVINRSLSNTLISGTSEADSITSSGQNVTIQSNGGNDTITGSDEHGELFNFSSADGDNVITNFGMNDTLKMTNGKTMTFATVGSDVVVSLQSTKYKSTVRLLDAAALTLKQSDKVLTVDSINEIINSNNNSLVAGTSGRDYIFNSGDHVTIRSGASADTIEGSDYAEVFLFGASDGDNVIINFGAGDTISLSGDGTLSYADVGSDVVVTLKSSGATGAVTLSGAADLDLNQSGKILTAKAIVTLPNSANDTAFRGTAGDDYMINTGNNVTITGGAGNDTIVGSTDGRELFRFDAADGNDVIYNFGTRDTLRIISGSISDSYADGSDYVIEVGDGTYSGSVTLKNVKAIKASGKNVTATRLNSQLPEYWFESEALEDELGELIGEAPLDNAIGMLEQDSQVSLGSARIDRLVTTGERHLTKRLRQD